MLCFVSWFSNGEFKSFRTIYRNSKRSEWSIDELGLFDFSLTLSRCRLRLNISRTRARSSKMLTNSINHSRLGIFLIVVMLVKENTLLFLNRNLKWILTTFLLHFIYSEVILNELLFRKSFEGQSQLNFRFVCYLSSSNVWKQSCIHLWKSLKENTLKWETLSLLLKDASLWLKELVFNEI